MNLFDLTSPDVDALSRDLLVLVPIGSIEQHGLHLPVSTDTRLVDAIAERVEARLTDVVLRLPTQWLGASGHHMAYPGTVTASLEGHIRVLIETVEAMLAHGFRRFYILNGHSGNTDTLRVACRQLKIDHPDGLFAGSSYWDIAAPEIAACLNGPRKQIGHSCEVETSIMLALWPDLVRTDRLRDDPFELTPIVRGSTIAFTFDEVSETGQIGYATAASAETGARLLEAVVSRTVEVVGHLATSVSIAEGETACR